MSILELGSNSIAPGQSQSFTHLFSGGYSYGIEVKSLDTEIQNVNFESYEKIFREFHLKVYTEQGQKIADNVGNFGPQCHFSISSGEPLKLKVVVSRDMAYDSRANDKIKYRVLVNNHNSVNQF